MRTLLFPAVAAAALAAYALPAAMAEASPPPIAGSSVALCPSDTPSRDPGPVARAFRRTVRITAPSPASL